MAILTEQSANTPKELLVWMAGHLSGGPKDYDIQYVHYTDTWTIQPSRFSTNTHRFLYTEALREAPCKVLFHRIDQCSGAITPTIIKKLLQLKTTPLPLPRTAIFETKGAPLVSLKIKHPEFTFSNDWCFNPQYTADKLYQMFQEAEDPLQFQETLLDAGLDQYAW